MSAIILRSDLRCPKKCDGRIIEKRGGFGKVEYLCDRCKIAVQPVPRMRLSESRLAWKNRRGVEIRETESSAIQPCLAAHVETTG